MFKVFYTIFLLGSLLLFSCNNRSEISSEFNCSSSKLKNLEKVTDVKELFNIHLPKNWKINLYQDKSQSSIFAADTIKELTETTLLDITFIKNKINFNEDFLLKQEQENLLKKLIRIKHKEITFLKQPSIYIHYKGKKSKLNYQTYHIFIKINKENFIFAKIEIYGNSLVNQRLCSAIQLIENIKIHQ